MFSSVVSVSSWLLGWLAEPWHVLYSYLIPWVADTKAASEGWVPACSSLTSALPLEESPLNCPLTRLQVLVETRDHTMRQGNLISKDMMLWRLGEEVQEDCHVLRPQVDTWIEQQMTAFFHDSQPRKSRTGFETVYELASDQKKRRIVIDLELEFSDHDLQSVRYQFRKLECLC